MIKLNMEKSQSMCYCKNTPLLILKKCIDIDDEETLINKINLSIYSSKLKVVRKKTTFHFRSSFLKLHRQTPQTSHTTHTTLTKHSLLGLHQQHYVIYLITKSNF